MMVLVSFQLRLRWWNDENGYTYFHCFLPHVTILSSLSKFGSSLFFPLEPLFKDGSDFLFFRWLFSKALVLVWVFQESEAKMWLDMQSHLLSYIPGMENGKGAGKGWINSQILAQERPKWRIKGRNCVWKCSLLTAMQSKDLSQSWQPFVSPCIWAGWIFLGFCQKLKRTSTCIASFFVQGIRDTVICLLLWSMSQHTYDHWILKTSLKGLAPENLYSHPLECMHFTMASSLPTTCCSCSVSIISWI